MQCGYYEMYIMQCSYYEMQNLCLSLLTLIVQSVYEYVVLFMTSCQNDIMFNIYIGLVICTYAIELFLYKTNLAYIIYIYIYGYYVWAKVVWLLEVQVLLLFLIKWISKYVFQLLVYRYLYASSVQIFYLLPIGRFQTCDLKLSGTPFSSCQSGFSNKLLQLLFCILDYWYLLQLQVIYLGNLCGSC